MRKVLIGIGLGAVIGAVLLSSRSRAGAPSASGVFETGKASFYGESYRGRPTASREIFNPDEMTAAHKQLRFGTKVRVTDVATGRHVDVRINDRGPFVAGRIIDLSEGAARDLGIIQRGVVSVELRLL